MFHSLFTKSRRASRIVGVSVKSLPGVMPIDHAQPQRVGAVLVDQVERVLHVALGLAHLHAALVADQAVQVDGVEGRLAGELAART